MVTTKHTVTNASGEAEDIVIAHTQHNAVQYDFYIPASIWSHEAVQKFLDRLFAIEPDATIFTNGLIGIWHGNTEQTQIYRFILRTDRVEKTSMSTALNAEIGQLMSDLADTPLKQDAFCYTETGIIMTTAEIASQQ